MVKHNGRVSVDIDLDVIEEEVLEWVQDRFRPDDIFKEKELSDWAEENGFTKDDA